MRPDEATQQSDRSSATDPLLGKRRLVDVRCGFAERARIEADSAESHLRDVRERLDAAVQAIGDAEAALEADTLTAAKVAAHRQFRKADRLAGDRAAVETAASAWLSQINAVNRVARAARLEANRQREIAARLEEELARSERNAVAARATAELAMEACLGARQALADAEAEGRVEVQAAETEVEPLAPEPARTEPAAPEAAEPAALEATPEPAVPEPAVPEPAVPEPVVPEPVVPAAVTSEALPEAPAPAAVPPAAATPEPQATPVQPVAQPASAEPPTPEPRTPAPQVEARPAPHSPVALVQFLPPLDEHEDETRPVLFYGDPNPPAILRLIAGEPTVLDGLAGQLGDSRQADQSRWRLLLTDLLDALVASAIDAGFLDFPETDSFWGLFSNEQSRDIARGLAALGYRYDGMGGFADGRLPGRRELSLAVGTAGVNPIRMRRWPERDETAALFASVTVATDQLVVERAPSLTFGEMVRLLGSRAESLAELWNEWHRVRPLLLDRG